MFRSAFRQSPLFLALLALVSGCMVDGSTPDCPEMPQDSDPNSQVVLDWRKAAEAAGCLTPQGEPFAPATGGSP